MSNINLNPRNRFLLAILWAVVTILLCYFFLFLGLEIFGISYTFDWIIGDVYTYTPALMAILFIIYFKTDTLSWDKFRNPGFKWLLFGLLYTLLVLALTITTDFLIGGLHWNSSYNPFTGDLQGFTTHIQILDIVLFIIIFGIMAIFSDGGFPRIVGEEFGWRGYLLPELLKLHPRLSIVISTIIVGLVWFCFHLPYFTFLAIIRDKISPDKVIFLILGALGVFLGANWAMTYAYLKTKSIWPAMILHYSWNLIAPVLIGNLYDGSLGLLNPNLSNLWLINGEGLIGGFFHFCVGLVFLFLIIRDGDSLLASHKTDEIVKQKENELFKGMPKGLPKRIKI